MVEIKLKSFISAHNLELPRYIFHNKEYQIWLIAFVDSKFALITNSLPIELDKSLNVDSMFEISGAWETNPNYNLPAVIGAAHQLQRIGQELKLNLWAIQDNTIILLVDNKVSCFWARGVIDSPKILPVFDMATFKSQNIAPKTLAWDNDKIQTYLFNSLNRNWENDSLNRKRDEILSKFDSRIGPINNEQKEKTQILKERQLFEAALALHTFENLLNS